MKKKINFFIEIKQENQNDDSYLMIIIKKKKPPSLSISQFFFV
jgi:hypothetical protein